MTLIDTAEMYGDGGAEEVVGAAIAGRRDQVFLVSKVYPHNAGARAWSPPASAACGDCAPIGSTSICCTGGAAFRSPRRSAGFERLRRDGKIVRWGVSNFDVADMEELLALAGWTPLCRQPGALQRERAAADYRLVPLCRERRIALMAYSPLGQGDLLASRKLGRIAREADSTPAALALAWALGRPGVIVIPKASNPVHVRANRAAADLRLDVSICAALDTAFPPPHRPTPLGIR